MKPEFWPRVLVCADVVPVSCHVFGAWRTRYSVVGLLPPIRKVHLRVIHCTRVIKITLTRTLEPEKQRTASQAVETWNTGIIPSHQTDVKRKVGTVRLSPGRLPHALIPVRTLQIRVRQQTVMVKRLVINDSSCRSRTLISGQGRADQ